MSDNEKVGMVNKVQAIRLKAWKSLMVDFVKPPPLLTFSIKNNVCSRANLLLFGSLFFAGFFSFARAHWEWRGREEKSH